MNANTVRVLRELLLERAVAALGTLQEGQPYVSMVPFALATDARALIIHVSPLAAHTGNMRRHGRVSVLVMEPERPDKMAQALARITLQGEARELAAGDPDYHLARQAYLRRFPDAAGLFDLPDFTLFRIAIEAARLVGGFAQAGTLTTDQIAEGLADEGGREPRSP